MQHFLEDGLAGLVQLCGHLEALTSHRLIYFFWGPCKELLIYIQKLKDEQFQLKSFQLFVAYMLSNKLQVQIQTQHSVDVGNYIKDEHNIETLFS